MGNRYEKLADGNRITIENCFDVFQKYTRISVYHISFFFVYRGFGFVTFADPSSVDKVLAQGSHELDGKKVSRQIHDIFVFCFLRKNFEEAEVREAAV